TLAAEELARRVHEELLVGGEVEVHDSLLPPHRLSPRLLARGARLGSNGGPLPHQGRGSHARASAGRPRPRVATVERRISEVPPAMVWPRLGWERCWMGPVSPGPRGSAGSRPLGT